MVGWVTKIAGLAAAPALLAASWPFLAQRGVLDAVDLSSIRDTVLGYLHRDDPTKMAADRDAAVEYACAAHHNYTTQIVSVDPLLIYIHGFLSDEDIAALLSVGDDLFQPSLTKRRGSNGADPQRTSHTAFLPVSDMAVQCVLDRARRFSGALLGSGGGDGSTGKALHDEMGKPQLVRYTKGQRFNLHFDWFPHAQTWKGPSGEDLLWNRVGSFFAILEDDCDEGETWFPFVNALSEVAGEGLWRKHPDGGVAFKPVKGNSLFWVNLKEDGEGDKRVKHAGLPVSGGRKTAMNIWPRRYFD